MSSKLAEITQDALRLPDDEQLRLARTLLKKSEACGDDDLGAVWEDEIERRIKSIDAGLSRKWWQRSIGSSGDDGRRRRGSGA